MFPDLSGRQGRHNLHSVAPRLVRVAGVAEGLGLDPEGLASSERVDGCRIEARIRGSGRRTAYRWARGNHRGGAGTALAEPGPYSIDLDQPVEPALSWARNDRRAGKRV